MTLGSIFLSAMDHFHMVAMLVDQNNPKKIELYFYANGSVCVMGSMWPLLT